MSTRESAIDTTAPREGGHASGVRRGAHRPVHLRPQYLVLVFIGGGIGAVARFLISAAVPDWQGVSIATFGINVTGAFLLGLLTQALVLGGRDVGLRRTARLLVGTGMLGGYTTYSTFAVGTNGLLVAGQVWWGLGYGLATVVVGGAASWAGIAMAVRLHRGRARRAAAR